MCVQENDEYCSGLILQMREMCLQGNGYVCVCVQRMMTTAVV